jgi:diguanylate cyclase (GGDEF)-like protein
MLVKEVMDCEPIAFDLDTPLEFAVQAMIKGASSCIIVTQNEAPCGIITERDITQVFASMVSHPESTTQQALPKYSVRDVMTTNPVCIQSELTFSEALSLSRSRRLRHLPVVDSSGKLIGIVSQTNLLDAYVQVMDEQSRLEDSIEELKLLSLEDPLMKIGNRRAMEVDLNHTEAEAIRHGKTFSIGLFDIDFFKKFNDAYGHQAGDEALRKIATAIKQAVRHSDRVFRYGGEEILVLMPETDIDEALICAERVRAAAEGLSIPHASSSFGHITLSGGVTSKHQGEWRNMVELADQALYEAKNSGRNSIVESSR